MLIQILKAYNHKHLSTIYSAQWCYGFLAKPFAAPPTTAWDRSRNNCLIFMGKEEPNLSIVIFHLSFFIEEGETRMRGKQMTLRNSRDDTKE